MANGAATFAIDDHKTVDENMAAYLAEISAIDAELAAVLAPKLGDWTRGKPLDHAALLIALLAATAPAEDSAE